MGFLVLGCSKIPKDANGRSAEALDAATELVPPANRQTVARYPGGPPVSASQARLELPELATDENSLYLGVTFSDPQSINNSLDTRTEVPEISVLANGLPLAPTFEGSVALRADDVSWLAVPLSQLPDGDLEMTIRLQRGLIERFLLLRKDGSRVVPITYNQRIGYTRTSSTHPVTGVTVRGSSVDTPFHDILERAAQ